MIEIAGGPSRLRPHIKTHKIAELITRQLELGISRFKCSTIAEAELTANAGGRDILVALQPVGPNVRRAIELVKRFPGSRFMFLADNSHVVRELSSAATEAHARIELLVDLDVGQHRTGMQPGAPALDLARLISSQPGLGFGGLHAYDGHIHDSDLVTRSLSCELSFSPVTSLRDTLARRGLQVPRIVAGGTPTFPIHIKRGDVECSPGTCVLWDAGYARKLPDLDFQPAAVILSRVISRPGTSRICLDLGHKAVASEMNPPRMTFLNLSDAVPIAHNEEHLVLESPRAESFAVGDVIYAIPWHICPTVALHQEVWVVDEHRAGARWTVAARDRRITI